MSGMRKVSPLLRKVRSVLDEVERTELKYQKFRADRLTVLAAVRVLQEVGDLTPMLTCTGHEELGRRCGRMAARLRAMLEDG